MRRQVIPELLDSDAGTEQEIAAALQDLDWINRCFGGIRSIRRMIEQVAQQTGRREFSVLDVAAGSGAVAADARTQLERSGIRSEWTLLDRSAKHLPKEAASVVGDALALPFMEASFDLVTCSLFLHHLEPEEVAQFLCEALRVCRVAVLITDLRRNWAHLALTHAGKLFYKSHFTRHDAPASVRRAYTMREIADMAQQARPSKMHQRRYWMMRSGTILYREQ